MKITTLSIEERNYKKNIYIMLSDVERLRLKQTWLEIGKSDSNTKKLTQYRSIIRHNIKEISFLLNRGLMNFQRAGEINACFHLETRRFARYQP